MARRPRLTLPGLPIHVTQRGHNHERTFLDEHDFAVYRECLRESSRRYTCVIHAYALMSNHIHLLMTPRTATSASGLMRSIGSRFVRYWNQRHRRSGTMWDGRFHSAIIGDTRYFLNCSRYIALNPVKAGMVTRPGDYEWSSYRALAHGASDDLVSARETYAALDNFGPATPETYQMFCHVSHDDLWLVELRRAMREGSAVGNPSALAAIEQRLGRSLHRYSHGGDRRRHRGADGPIGLLAPCGRPSTDADNFDPLCEHRTPPA